MLGIMDSAKSGHLSTAFSSIATVTAAGGETSITLSSIPAAYTDLQVRVLYRDTTASNSVQGLFIRFNGDSGNNYASHNLNANNTTIAATGNATQAFMKAIALGLGDTATASAFGVGIIDISDYTSASKNKTIRVISASDTNTSAVGQVDVASGAWFSTSAITSITFVPVGAAAKAGSVFSLYGIKAAA